MKSPDLIFPAAYRRASYPDGVPDAGKRTAPATDRPRVGALGACHE